MGDLMHALVLIGRRADDMKDQRTFRFRAHHTVHGRQFSDPIGRRQHRLATDARIAVRGIRRIQFVGAANPLHLGAAVHRIANRKQIVAGDAKAVAYALCGEALDDVICNASCFHGGGSFCWSDLLGHNGLLHFLGYTAAT